MVLFDNTRATLPAARITRPTGLPNGEDMIHKLHGLFNTATLADLTNKTKKMHVEVEDVEQVGRTVLVTFERSG